MQCLKLCDIGAYIMMLTEWAEDVCYHIQTEVYILHFLFYTWHPFIWAEPVCLMELNLALPFEHTGHSIPQCPLMGVEILLLCLYLNSAMHETIQLYNSSTP